MLPHLRSFVRGAGRNLAMSSSLPRGMASPAVSERAADETATIVTQSPSSKLHALREQLGQDQRTLNDFLGVESKDEVWIPSIPLLL